MRSVEPYILAVCGSPRKGGNSDILCDHVLKGAESVGARTEKVYLYDIALRPCTACGACQKPDQETCVLPDDMRKLAEKVAECDALVIGSPIYTLNITGVTKLFLERLYPIASAVNRQFVGKRVVVCLTYGYHDPAGTGVNDVISIFNKFFGFFDVSSTFIHASASEKGAIRSNTAVLEQAVAAGKSVAKS